jgi:cysteine synthase
MLYSAMTHRTQLYLEDDQYRWLRRRAGSGGSIAGVVRELVDAARSHRPILAADPLIEYLIDETPADSGKPSTVESLDQDIYG